MRYTSHREGAAFAADLSIAGSMQTPWTLRFTMPQGQRVDEVTPLPWSQTDAQVQLAGTQPLIIGKPVDVSVTGDLERMDAPAPSAFEINGIGCDVVASVVIATQADMA